MLSGFESFLAGLIGARLAGRPGLTVAIAGAPPSPSPGTAVLQLGLSAATPDAGNAFSPGDVLPPVNVPSIRAVPLQATIGLTLTRRASAVDPASITTARGIALADATVLVHTLDQPEIRDGRALVPGVPDPGFRAREFAFTALSIAPANGDVVSWTATYACSLFVWPPGTPAAGGPILAVDALIESQPLTLQVEPAVVSTGGTARVTVVGVAGSRLVDPTGARVPLQLAVGVVSDLDPARRGSIDGGVAAGPAGFRVVDVTQPATTVDYLAPAAGQLGVVRAEEVVVHLAVPSDGPAPGVGVRLGSVVVGLREAP